MARLPIIAALLLPLALAACGGDGASAPGGVSPGEAKQLEDAAEMLDARRLPPKALPTAVPTPPPPAADLTGDAARPRP